MVQVTVTGVADGHINVTVLLPREALTLNVLLYTLKETNPTFCCSMCSCYIGTDVSSLVPVCPEQLPEYWSTGVLEYRSTGVPEYWSTGVPECRNTGILSLESRKSSIPIFWKPLHFCSLLRGFRCSEVLIIPVFHCSEVFNIPAFHCSGVGIPWSTGEFLMLS